MNDPSTSLLVAGMVVDKKIHGDTVDDVRDPSFLHIALKSISFEEQSDPVPMPNGPENDSVLMMS